MVQGTPETSKEPVLRRLTQQERSRYRSPVNVVRPPVPAVGEDDPSDPATATVIAPFGLVGVMA